MLEHWIDAILRQSKQSSDRERSGATIDWGLEILGVDFALRRRGEEQGER